MRTWSKEQGTLPSGVVAAWFAIENDHIFAGVFQTLVGDFVLAYHVPREQAARTERFTSFQMAQDRANYLLSTIPVLGRKR